MSSTRIEHPESAFIPFQAVCHLLGIHYNTGYALRREGRFPVPVEPIGGRYFCRRSDVDNFVDGDHAA